MIYVDDPLLDHRPGKRCHLSADTTAELHEFAERLGLSPAAFHAGPRGREPFDRYDITAEQRAQALAAGAVAEAWRDGAYRKLDRIKEAMYA